MEPAAFYRNLVTPGDGRELPWRATTGPGQLLNDQSRTCRQDPGWLAASSRFHWNRHTSSGSRSIWKGPESSVPQALRDTVECSQLGIEWWQMTLVFCINYNYNKFYLIRINLWYFGARAHQQGPWCQPSRLLEGPLCPVALVENVDDSLLDFAGLGL